jgi:hypothetical protein
VVSGADGNPACPALCIAPGSIIDCRTMTVAADYHDTLPDRQGVDVTVAGPLRMF